MTALTIPTAEPFFFPGGPTGCLVVHGFTGAPKEMRWMGEYLASQGFTVLGVRLAGHATRPEDMARTHWIDWLASVEDGLNILKGCTKEQFVMGLSMGGVLSLLTAARVPVAGAVAVSAPAHIADPRTKYLPFMQYLMPKIVKGGSDMLNKDAASDHVDYPYYPTHSVLELRDLITEMRASLPAVKVPVFLVQSHKDQVIPPDSMDLIYNELGTADKETMWVENSGHVVVREPDREAVFKAVTDFVQRKTTLK